MEGAWCHGAQDADATYGVVFARARMALDAVCVDATPRARTLPLQIFAMPAFASSPVQSPPLAASVSIDYLAHHRVCPKAVTAEGTLVVAVGPDALVPEALDDLAFAYARPVVADAAPQDEVERLIARLASGVASEGASVDSPSDEAVTDVRDQITQPPVIACANRILDEAHEAEASDIHLEATREGLVVRYRIDGVLVPGPALRPELAHPVISRLKLLSNLDIAERRRPQDGRLRIRLASRELDLRVATVPTLFGESVVLRLLDQGGRPVSLDALGMPAPILEGMRAASARPHGLVLVTGPTGSGKTTTLYAALLTRNAQAEKILTVEDPIEYQLNGITQIPVHRDAGVSFATALRAMLRQDPDVVMVGEMRDPETAAIAVQAAMTGHLVFSTVHTNDALGAIPRLIDLGVPAYLVAATLDAVLAQRLVRRICPACREGYRPVREQVALLAGADGIPAELTRGAGCPACRQTGYRGRIGVFEWLPVTDALRDAVAHGASRAEVRRLAHEAGLRPLAADGWVKITQGLTTVEEVLRVVES